MTTLQCTRYQVTGFHHVSEKVLRPYQVQCPHSAHDIGEDGMLYCFDHYRDQLPTAQERADFSFKFLTDFITRYTKD